MSAGGMEGDVAEWKDKSRRRERTAKEGGGKPVVKDADVVVVDASVLVHALGRVKKWCREGRGEVIIVPLEGKFLFLLLS